jgi:hypothetical protein
MIVILLFYLLLQGEQNIIPEIFSVPFRKWEKIICSISIWNTSRITYDFIEGHSGKSISKSNNNDGHHMVCQCVGAVMKSKLSGQP